VLPVRLRRGPPTVGNEIAQTLEVLGREFLSLPPPIRGWPWACATTLAMSQRARNARFSSHLNSAQVINCTLACASVRCHELPAGSDYVKAVGGSSRAKPRTPRRVTLGSRRQPRGRRGTPTTHRRRTERHQPTSSPGLRAPQEPRYPSWAWSWSMVAWMSQNWVAATLIS
jgi:hypothetical protein